jgi:hypothetical protein
MTRLVILFLCSLATSILIADRIESPLISVPLLLLNGLAWGLAWPIIWPRPRPLPAEKDKP